METRVIILIGIIVLIFAALIIFTKYYRKDGSGKEMKMSRISQIGASIIGVAIISNWILNLEAIFGANYFLYTIGLGVIGFIVFVIGLFQK